MKQHDIAAAAACFFCRGGMLSGNGEGVKFARTCAHVMPVAQVLIDNAPVLRPGGTDFLNFLKKNEYGTWYVDFFLHEL